MVKRSELHNQLCRSKNQETKEFDKTERKQERGEAGKDTRRLGISRLIQPFIRMRKYKEIADE